MRAEWATNVSGNRISIEGITIKGLVNKAFGIDTRLIAGPSWVTDGEETFAIQAIMPSGSSKDQLAPMLRELLRERFHFSYHLVLVDRPGYVLAVGRNGPKLRRARDLDPAVCKQWEDGLGPPGSGNLCRLSEESNGQIVTTRINKQSAYGPSLWSITGRDWHEEFYRITMPTLAHYLTGRLSPVEMAGGTGPSPGPPVNVADRTGIVGEWDVTIDSTTEDGLLLSSLISSLEKQGLRLDKATVPLEQMFIDAIDRVPSEN
jgi:uncharacterized protein (TIGR03435 family)